MAAVRFKGGKLNRVITGGNDLVEDFEDGTVDLNALAQDELPEELKGLGEGDLRAAIEARVAERSQLNAEMADLVTERDAWISDELERRAEEEGGEDDFDVVVTGTIRAQAAEAGIAYKE